MTDYSVPNAYVNSIVESAGKDTAYWLDPLFGRVELLGKDESATAASAEQGHAVDMYNVHHSGYRHVWSSSLIMASLVNYGMYQEEN